MKPLHGKMYETFNKEFESPIRNHRMDLEILNSLEKKLYSNSVMLMKV